MTKVKDHFKIAEYVGSDYSHPVAGHYYSYKNDPVGHGNHVHVAFLPWGEPDEHGASPPNTGGDGSAAAKAYREAFEAKFGNKYRWGGTYVYKHRNSDPNQPWSQHAEDHGNAVDYMADGAEQQPIIDWLESEWEDDVTEAELRDLLGVGDNFDLKQIGDVTSAIEGVKDGKRPSNADRAAIYDAVVATKLPPGTEVDLNATVA